MMKFPLIAGTTYETQHKLTYTAPYFHNGPVKRLDENIAGDGQDPAQQGARGGGGGGLGGLPERAG